MQRGLAEQTENVANTRSTVMTPVRIRADGQQTTIMVERLRGVSADGIIRLAEAVIHCEFELVAGRTRLAPM